MTNQVSSICRKRKPTAGITLLEIMIVLAIMALIVGLAAPRVLENFGKAKSRTAEVQLANLNSALQLYYIDVGRYPSETEGLDGLLQAPTGVEAWDGPYIDNEKGKIDPWGRPYYYLFPGQNAVFDLFTYGRDGQVGGNSEDSDIAL